MFERFTEEARKVVVLAQEEARFFGHGRIGTEHVLLGLWRVGEATAAHTLPTDEIPSRKVREEVVNAVGRGGEVGSGQAPFTPGAKRIIEGSSLEARDLGHDDVGTGHILLALMKESDSVAARILRALGVDLDKARRDTIEAIERLLGYGFGPDTMSFGGGAPKGYFGGPPPGPRLETPDEGWDFGPPPYPPPLGGYGVSRTRIEGLEVRVQSQILYVNLDYARETEPEDGNPADCETVMEEVAKVFEGEPFEHLESVAEGVGRCLLGRFPSMVEGKVEVVKRDVAGPRPVKEISVQSYFGR